MSSLRVSYILWVSLSTKYFCSLISVFQIEGYIAIKWPILVFLCTIQLFSVSQWLLSIFIILFKTDLFSIGSSCGFDDLFFCKQLVCDLMSTILLGVLGGLIALATGDCQCYMYVVGFCRGVWRCKPVSCLETVQYVRVFNDTHLSSLYTCSYCRYCVHVQQHMGMLRSFLSAGLGFCGKHSKCTWPMWWYLD